MTTSRPWAASSDFQNPLRSSVLEVLYGRFDSRVSWDGSAEPVIVGQARRAVTAFAAASGISGARLDAVRACVSEAVTNAVMQPSFPDARPDGTVQVYAEIEGETLNVVVAAEGIGFMLSNDCPQQGMRLGTITALADSMSFATQLRGGNRLSMTFQLTGPDLPAA